MAIDIQLRPGERGLLVGQTGSGKTAGAIWQIAHTAQRVIICDTKGEPAFDSFPIREEETRIQVATVADLKAALQDKRGAAYIILRPPPGALADMALMDAYLECAYRYGQGWMVFIDELYQWHSGGRAGPGLIGLLTRGRSKGTSTLMATQRPSWVTRFALTEATRYYVYRLIDQADRKRLGEVIEGFSDTLNPPPFHWWYSHNGDRAILMKPVPLLYPGGYVPEPKSRWI